MFLKKLNIKVFDKLKEKISLQLERKANIHDTPLTSWRKNNKKRNKWALMEQTAFSSLQKIRRIQRFSVDRFRKYFRLRNWRRRKKIKDSSATHIYINGNNGYYYNRLLAFPLSDYKKIDESEPKSDEDRQKLLLEAVREATRAYSVLKLSKTKNNIYCSITNLFGDHKTLWSLSGGMTGEGKKSSKAEKTVINSSIEKLKELNVKYLVLEMDLKSPSKFFIIKRYLKLFRLLLIKDKTGIAHNGCRLPKKRRL